MSTAGVVVSAIHEKPVFSLDYFNIQLDFSLNDSIMIFLATSDSVVPMRVLESDSIASLKLRIQTDKERVKNHKLVCGGRELARRNSLVRDYGVTNGNIVHLISRLSDLQVINVKTVSGKEFNLNVDKTRDVAYVKQKVVENEEEIIDLEDQEVFFDGEKLDDESRIHDICKDNEVVIHLVFRKSAEVQAKRIDNFFELSIVSPNLNDKKNYELDGEIVFENVSDDDVMPRKSPHREYCLDPVIVNPKIELSNGIKDLIKSTYDGLDGGSYPIRSSEGTGGVYFMKDSLGEKHVSVFKPIDEEPLAINNPRGLPVSTGEGLKRGTVVGEGALREVAAYILDHPKSGRRSYSNDEEKGFAGVPTTFLVRCMHKGFNHPHDVLAKIGSLQKFIENKGSCEDMVPRDFPVKEVHKISVLDMRLANADRHGGNILISGEHEGGQNELIPIDHGYCLPESFEDCTFEWLYWPQARQPYNADTIEYIKSLDAEEDIALLKFYGWDLSPQCARIFRISTMLLKKGAERGLTPFVIGNMMCRETLNKESVIEEIVQEAHDSVLPCTSEETFLESVSKIMDRYLGEIPKS